MMKEKVTIRHAVEDHLRGIQELHKVAPKFFPLLTVNSVFIAIIPYISVFFSAKILSELATYRRADILWRWVIVGVLCVGLVSILGAIIQRRTNTMLNDLWGRKEILFIHKMFSLDFSELDKRENLDMRTQIRQNEGWSSWGLMRIISIYEDSFTNVFGIISGIALTISLFTTSVPEGGGWLTIMNSPLLVLLLVTILLAVGVLAGKLTAKSTKFWSDYEEDATFGNRLFGHFAYVGNDKERSVDIRMNNQQKLIGEYWKKNYGFGTESVIGKCARGKMGVYASLGVCISTLNTGFIYVITCLKAWGGAFDVGSVTQYVGAATAMVRNIYVLTTVVGEIKTNAVYLDKTFEFLDIPNSMYQGSLTTEKRTDRKYEVEFKNVSFKYTGSDIWALRHVNMKFKIGKRLAIVGENGSGKTTFIKLLCRLYDPQEGEILLNGIDIRKYRYDDYMDIFSVVFQDFQLICQTLGSNVAGSMHYDRDKVRSALIDAGFGDRLNSLEKGLDTMLYKEMADDGVEVSGGEAQKIAIARALYKDAPFIILDEPTASLDPIAEAEIYGKFDEITGDKTAIYISHRLSSCKFCDEIAVFHEGTVIQQGSHEELVKNENGKYYELWNAQAQYYNV